MRLTVALCLALAASLAPSQALARDPNSRVRCLDTDAERVVDRAVGLSPTVRRLVAGVERSNLILFVRVGALLEPGRAETRFMTSAGGVRYLEVVVDARAGGMDLIALLGHELQHANEVAADATVSDSAGMRRLFERIGHPNGGPNRFETTAAVETGRLVLAEVRGQRVTASFLDQDEAPRWASRRW